MLSLVVCRQRNYPSPSGISANLMASGAFQRLKRLKPYAEEGCTGCSKNLAKI